jgi:adenylate cyclase class IV
VAQLADSGPTPIAQDDTFFHCAVGRLKLREFADGSAELIAYDRADTAGPKVSTYQRVPVVDPALLRDALATACGVLGRVRKQRRLYLIGATRVHLDEVEGLGPFLELEVVLSEAQTAAHGVALARHLLERLGIGADRLVAGAYLDLLTAKDLQP